VEKRGVVRWAAIVVAVGFVGLAAFEFALAMGAPLGRAAWGGTQTELPTGLRAASAFAIVFYVLAALIVLRRAGYAIHWVSPRLARWGTWALAVILPLSAVANFASQSPWERYLMGPIALVLGALCFVVARGARPIVTKMGAVTQARAA
jgi:hypothetical protein